jgi:hypothetical protein
LTASEAKSNEAEKTKRLTLENSPAIDGWVFGSETGQVPRGRKNVLGFIISSVPAGTSSVGVI